MKNVKRVVAVIAIVVLVGMYVTTLVMAICDSSATMSMFKGCIGVTIFVPIMAYVYICLHKYAMNRSGRKDYYDNKADKEEKKEEQREEKRGDNK